LNPPSHDLARRNTARLRYGHLGLLIQIVNAKVDAEDNDPWVTQVEYMEERAELGEDYPDESTLRNAYGNWISTVKASAAFALRGVSRITSSPHM
jgi:hypothetical protein